MSFVNIFVLKLLWITTQKRKNFHVWTNFFSFLGWGVNKTPKMSEIQIETFENPLGGLNFSKMSELKGVSLKTWPFHFLLFQHILFNSLATNMLESWDLYHSKGEIHSSVWRTKTFLYNISKPRVKQNCMGYQISRI